MLNRLCFLLLLTVLEFFLTAAARKNPRSAGQNAVHVESGVIGHGGRRQAGLFVHSVFTVLGFLTAARAARSEKPCERWDGQRKHYDAAGALTAE